MIIENKTLSMAEATEFMKDKELKAFTKKFISLSPEKAKELRTKLEELDLIKINENHITKMIDLMPQDKESLNKIFVDINLDEDEQNNLLQTIKEFK